MQNQNVTIMSANFQTKVVLTYPIRKKQIYEQIFGNTFFTNIYNFLVYM